MEWHIEKTNEIVNGAKLEMTLTPFMVEKMKEVLEIEMLQGDAIPLPDGRTKYIITTSDEKAAVIKEELLKLIAPGNNN